MRKQTIECFILIHNINISKEIDIRGGGEGLVKTKSQVDYNIINHYDRKKKSMVLKGKLKMEKDVLIHR